MLRDKNIVLRYTPAARAAEAAGLLLICAVLYIVAVMYPGVPEQTPTRFDELGAPIAWGARETVLLGPILAVFLYLALTGIGVIIRKLAPENNPKGVLSAVTMTILCVKSLLLACVAGDTYHKMQGAKTPEWIPILAIGAGAATVALGVWLAAARYNNAKSAAT